MITTLGEYALKAAIKIGLNIHSFHRSEVDEQIRSAFEYAVNDWSKHGVGITTRINLKQALEAYAQIRLHSSRRIKKYEILLPVLRNDLLNPNTKQPTTT